MTCAPLGAVDIRSELQQLRKEYSTSLAALKAQEETAKQVKQRLKDAEEKRDHIQRLMKTKTEVRETERKVFSKIKQGKEKRI